MYKRSKAEALSTTALVVIGSLLANTANALVLESNDGETRITGTYISDDGQSITIDTVAGVITVPMDIVTCTGNDCPDVSPANDDITIGADTILFASVVEPLVSAAATNDQTVVRMRGEGSQDIGYVFRDENGDDGQAIFTQSLGSNDGFDALLRGDIDLLLSMRQVNQTEVQSFIDAGFPDISQQPYEVIVATHGIVPIVSHENPVATLTAEQLTDVFSGKVSNWSQIGGPSQPIRVMAPGPSISLSQIFYDELLEPNFEEFSADIQTSDSLGQLVETVAFDPTAIGFTSSAFIGNAKELPVTLDCQLTVSPTNFNIKAEDYPFSQRVYMYSTSENLTPATRNIMETITSNEGQDIFETIGFASLATSSTGLDSQGVRMTFSIVDRNQRTEFENLRRFSEAVFGGNRLSTTLRFSSGSSNLDNRALQALDELAVELAGPQFQGKEIMIVGFTDSIGRSEVNLSLSQRRAQQVANNLIGIGGDRLSDRTISAFGFGAAGPTSCNTTNEGRDINRRVEVWVR